MSRSGLEGLIVPVIDLLMLVKRTVTLHIALAKIELRSRVGAIITAVALCLIALVLVVVLLGLLVQAGLLGLALLGLGPIEALLTASAICALLALILVLVARRLVRRATLPLSSLSGPGVTPPASHP